MLTKSQTSWLIASAFLIFFTLACFYQLDRFSLWQDEAETALLAKSILKNGLPIALFDGKWVTQFTNGQESTTNHLWHMTPWLPFYICALGLKTFGVSDWAARFPFAVAGVLAALLLFRVTLRWTKSHTAALLALFFYVTNPTVLIYTRQCKYLPVYLLGTLTVLYGILSWSEEKRGTFLTIFGFLILFYTNFLAAGLALSGFGLYALVTKEGGNCRPLFFKTTLGVFLFFGPFLLLAPLHARLENHAADITFTLGAYFKKLGTHIYYWNGQIFPLLLAPLLFWRRPPYFKFIACTVLASWLLLPLFKDVLRYNLHLIPIFCILLGFLFSELFQRRRVAAIILFALLVGTNFFQNIPDAIAQKSLRPIFLKEDWIALKNYYFKDYVDPMKVIPKLIAQHSKKGETVYLNHDQLAWQWASDIPFAYLAEGSKMSERTPPLENHWTDRNAIDWWIGPHKVKMIYGLYIPQEEIESQWRKAGYKVEIIDTQIPIMNWDLSSPIRYKQFLDRFSGNPLDPETIKLVHRVR